MIFISLGTHERPFYRLVKEVERLILKKKIKEKVVVQLGFTNYIIKGAECYRFIPEKKMSEFIKKSSMLITHGGLGSIMRGIEAGKVVIAVPRRRCFGEHTDDHQLQIVGEAKKRGSVIVVHEIRDLENAIEKAKKIKPKKRLYKPKKMLKLVGKILEEWSSSYS